VGAGSTALSLTGQTFFNIGREGVDAATGGSFDADQLVDIQQAKQEGRETSESFEAVIKNPGAAAGLGTASVVAGASGLATGDVTGKTYERAGSKAVKNAVNNPEEVVTEGFKTVAGAGVGTAVSRVGTGAAKLVPDKTLKTSSTSDLSDPSSGIALTDDFSQQQALTAEGRKTGVNAYSRDTFGFRTDRSQRIIQDTEPGSTGGTFGPDDVDNLAGKEFGKKSSTEKIADKLSNTRKGQARPGQKLIVKEKKPDTSTSTKDTVSISEEVDRLKDKTKDLVDGDTSNTRKVIDDVRTRKREFNKPEGVETPGTVTGAAVGLGTGQGIISDQKQKQAPGQSLRQINDQEIVNDQEQVLKEEQVLDNPQKQDQDNVLVTDKDSDIDLMKRDNRRKREEYNDFDLRRDRDRGIDFEDEDDNNQKNKGGIFIAGKEKTQYRASVGAELIGLRADKKPGQAQAQDPLGLRPIVDSNGKKKDNIL